MSERTITLDDPTAESVLGVIVVNFASHHLLDTNLVTISHTNTSVAIVVIDNYSSDRERAAVTESASRMGWHLLTPPVNLGFGGACNLGAARALELGCDSFVFLNPDASITSDGIAKLGELARSSPRALISPVIERPDGSIWFRGSEINPLSGALSAVCGVFESAPDRWLTGACLTVHRELWQELDGFADGYFLYWEDVDLSRRCVELGGALLVTDQVRAVHDAGGTQIRNTGSAKSAIYYYFNCRNRLLFASRLLPTPQLIRWLVRTPSQSMAILLRGGRRQFVRQPSLFFAGVRGSLVGVGYVARELFQRTTRRISGSRVLGLRKGRRHERSI